MFIILFFIFFFFKNNLLNKLMKIRILNIDGTKGKKFKTPTVSRNALNQFQKLV